MIGLGLKASYLFLNWLTEMETVTDQALKAVIVSILYNRFKRSKTNIQFLFIINISNSFLLLFSLINKNADSHFLL